MKQHTVTIDLHLIIYERNFQSVMMTVNPFQANVPFLYPLKIRGFLTFSGGIERENWLEMG